MNTRLNVLAIIQKGPDYSLTDVIARARAKRLLQQYRTKADIARLPRSIHQ
jgi:hypothetical protein